MLAMKHHQFFTVIVLALLSIALTGCGGGGGGSKSSSKAKWTVLVYMNAANSLDSYAEPDINEMEQVGSSDNLNIIVQVKRRNTNYRNTRRMLITKDDQPNVVTSTVAEDLGLNVDMGSYDTLKSFIQWGAEKYPSDHIAVIIWNHGDGWRSKNTTNPITKAISEDDLTGNHIEVWQLPQALRPLDSSPVLDVVAFDACYMQMAEVAQEIRFCTKYICGSEEYFPGEGYPYNLMLAPLRNTPSISAKDFAVSLVNNIFSGLSVDGNITQSALDASRITELTAAVNTFGQALIDSTITKDEANVVRTQTQAYVIADNKDLYDYAERMAALRPTDTNLQSAYTNLISVLKSTVVNEKHTSDSVINSHGIAIYVPSRLDFDSNYLNTAFSRATCWDEWLQAQGQ